ncbi:MAG TPA: helix-hairpin-helix domain-containing protein, partial [Bacteroidales bacterium]|nr:helix-hairpin-helix domain-containing protein [Bacteroidales bacterium]
WEIVMHLTKLRNTERIKELNIAVSENRVLSDYTEIWEAVQKGKGKTLFVKKDFFQAAKIIDGKVELISKIEKDDTLVIDDIVDEIIEFNMANGGDVVFVEKGGDIIPKITGVDFNRRPKSSQTTEFIRQCPECGATLIRNEGEAAHYCPNDSGCPPQIKGRLEHFISRKAMNIESLGEGRIEILYENDLVKSISDFYYLSNESLLGLEKIFPADGEKKERRVSFREKTVENIMTGIENSKQVPFQRVLYALGIRYVGETVARKLAVHFGNIDALIMANTETLTSVPEIGERIAGSITDYFSKPENIRIIAKLKDAGIQMKTIQAEEPIADGKLVGLSFVVSGVFQNFSREGIKQVISEQGGRVLSAVSANTSFLVAGDKMGPAKIQRAEAIGVKIISEAEFMEMIK